MAVIEGGVSGGLAGVGSEAASPQHVAIYPVSQGAGGAYALGAVSGTIAAALGANSELFQFRYTTAASRIALVRRVFVSASANLAATAAALVSLNLCAARSWTANGSGGTAITTSGDNLNLRTTMPASEIANVRMATTAALGAGTKTLDTTDLASVAFGIGTGALTTAANFTLLPSFDLWNSRLSGDHPIVIASQEGLVIRSGAIAFPATMTWSLAVGIVWSEVDAF